MAKQKRPPRQVWCVVNDNGVSVGVYPTRKAAWASLDYHFATLAVVGPYVLAERKRNG